MAAEKTKENVVHHFGDSRQQSDYLSGVSQVAAKGGAEAPAPDLPIGLRVQKLREEKGLTIADLAQRTGLEEKLLADVESQAASPPLGVLVKLGKALDMKLGTLISTGEVLPYTVVRVSERQDMSRFGTQKRTAYGYSYQALAPRKKNRSMEPFFVTLQKAEQEVPPSAHDGEEFIFVLEGSMEAIVGSAREVLQPGDCIYYDSSVPHLLKPHGEGPTRIVAVIYAPQR